jgi:hypothetical protein
MATSRTTEVGPAAAESQIIGQQHYELG